MKPKKKIKKIVIGFAIIIFFAMVVLGFRGGFYPLEHRIIIRNAERYVIETYGLTPTNVRITTLYLWFPVTVRVETEEHGFWFQLRTGRFSYSIEHFDDDYLSRTIDYILSRELNAYVEEVTNGRGMAWASLRNRRMGIQNQLSLSELEADQDAVFEKLQYEFRLGISIFEDIRQNNYDIDYDLLFDIYSRVFELGLRPLSLYFSFNSFNERDGETFLAVSIDKEHFPGINLPDDLRSFFEEEIQRRLDRD